MGSREKAFQFLREVPRLSEGNIGKLPGNILHMKVPLTVLFLLIEFYNIFKFAISYFVYSISARIISNRFLKLKQLGNKILLLYTHP